jgi:hypothetical protein
MDVPFGPSTIASPFSTPSSPVLLSPRRSGDFDLYATLRSEASSPIQRHFPGRVGARTSLVLDDPAAIASVFPPTPEKKREKDRGLCHQDEAGKLKASASRPASPKKPSSPQKALAASPRKTGVSAPRDRASTIRVPTLGVKVPTSARTATFTVPRSQTRDETKLQSKHGVRSSAASPRPLVVALPPTARSRSGPPSLMAPPPIPNARAPITSAVALYPSVLSSAPATRPIVPPVMISAPARRSTEPIPIHPPPPPESMPRPVPQNQQVVDAAALGLVLPKTPELVTSSFPGKTELDKTPRPTAPVKAAPVPAAPSKPTAVTAADTSIGVVSGSGSDASDKWEKIDQVSQELLNLPPALVRKQSAKTMGSMSGSGVKDKRRSKRTCIFLSSQRSDSGALFVAAPLDLVHPGYNREHYQHQLSPLDGSGRQTLMSPFLGFGFGGFSWGVPPTPTVGGTPQGTGRGMFAKLFDWKSPVRSAEVL